MAPHLFWAFRDLHLTLHPTLSDSAPNLLNLYTSVAILDCDKNVCLHGKQRTSLTSRHLWFQPESAEEVEKKKKKKTWECVAFHYPKLLTLTLHLMFVRKSKL